MHSDKRTPDEQPDPEELDALEREELRESLATELQQFEQGLEG